MLISILVFFEIYFTLAKHCSLLLYSFFLMHTFYALFSIFQIYYNYLSADFC